MSKLTIYVDCDDTILDSSKTVIRILNKRYGLNKTIDDLADYGYRSIVPSVTQEEILAIYESEEFWKEVELNEEFLKVFNKLKKDFQWIALSCGTAFNLIKKRIFIEEKLFIHLQGEIITSSEEGSSTKKINQHNCIQIDNHMGCLHNSNAAIKILFQGGKLHYWNQVEPNEDNLYAAMTWKQIGEILEFFAEHPEMVERTYGE